MKTKVVFLVLLILCFAHVPVGFAGSLEDTKQNIEKNIFPKDKVIDVKIKIDESDLEDMLNNPMKEEYKIAEVDYNGHRLSNIAIRTKGNSSLNTVARQDSDRYSFKISFDQYISSQNLFGLTKINLNNSFSDPTYMREFLSYELFAEMGVPTPEYSFVNVYINDQLWGFYLAVEQINESFLSRNFEHAYGALYKPDGVGSDLLWKGNNIDDYSGLNLKSDKSNKDIVLKMLDELNNGSDYEKYINVDEVLRYLAVSTVLANLDSYQGNFKHNYYLYEENCIFSIIPWDLNMSFAGFGMGANNGQAVEMLIDEPTMGKVSERPLIDKLLQNKDYKQKYHNYINEIVSGYLSPERFEKRVQELSAFISPYVKEDPTKFCTFEEHQKSLHEDVQNTVGLTSFVTARVDNVRKQLDGTLLSYKNGEGLTVSRGAPGNRDAGGRPAMVMAENADGNNQISPNGAPPGDWDPQADGEMGGGRMPPMGQDGQFPGMRGGMGGQMNENSKSEAFNTAIMFILLIMSLVFVSKYKNKRI